MKFLGISGSLRAKSCNRGLLRAAAASLPSGVSLEIADLLDIPFFNADYPEPTAGVQRVLDQIAAADALVLACPEYNHSLAPALKNIIDWASRAEGNALLAGKPVAILGAGGGMGTSRAQGHLRQVLSALNLHALNKPEVFANAFSDSFDVDGNLVDERLLHLIGTQMQALQQWVQKLKG